jgi:hypothetical protein
MLIIDPDGAQGATVYQDQTMLRLRIGRMDVTMDDLAQALAGVIEDRGVSEFVFDLTGHGLILGQRLLQLLHDRGLGEVKLIPMEGRGTYVPPLMRA